jgi:predicted DsbA family dithiol-disulfide isomerase
MVKTLLFLCVTAALTPGCSSSPRPIEDAIANTAAKAKPGTITVVEFVDYKCDFCKGMNDVLSPLLEQQQGQVSLYVKHVPLDKHPGAKRAAEVAICAEAQGKLPPVHEALMNGAAVDDDSVLDTAQRAGLDVEVFKACLRSDAPKQRIARDIADWEAVGADGLPMVFIQRQKFVGLVAVDPLERALREASP